MMLMDKGYYDYDYEAVKEKSILTAEDREIWSQEKLHAILGVKPKKKTLTPEELQAEVMGDLKKYRDERTDSGLYAPRLFSLD